jgi:tetratricopeptide (TPR) repeat protein
MSVWFWALLVAIALIGWLAAYMLSQKPITNAQQLIQMRRYEDAAMEAARTNDALHRAEALKLLGRYEEAIAAYRESTDPSAREGIALSLAHLGRDLDEARQLMETQLAQFPQIQEFQSLVLAYVLLRAGDTEGALRLYRDNVELLETRFRDDYTDPDPLLSETLYLYGVLADANGEEARADSLYREAERWGWTDFRRRGQHGQSTDDRSPHPVPGDPASHT